MTTPVDTGQESDASPSTNTPNIKSILIAGVAILIALWIGTAWGQPTINAIKGLWHSGHDQKPAVAAGGHDHSGAGGAPASDATEYFTCGMHPWVVLPKEGTCPICQMDLTPIDPSKFTGEVSISPLIVQNIGVRIAPVTEGPLVKTIRTVGSIDYDETKVRDVNIKINGWIEKLHVDYLGAEVERDDPLFELYSPELYSAQEEYLLAWRNRDKVGADFVPEAAIGAASLLDAARTKLEYFDITEQQIAALQKSDKPAKTMTIRSPHTGVVIMKHANEGMKVNPGMQVYRIADLSKVWTMVTLYEQQLPFVTVGQAAVMTLPYIPGQTFEGKVIYVYPYLETKTRQVKVRLEFDNPNMLLKPGMFVNVELRGTLAKKTTLAPRSAVIDTGERTVAFVSLGEGKFEPRDVQLGPETENGRVQILDGLKPGEMVVTSGQFLIDSEAKMREALAKMIKGDMAADQQAVADVIDTAHLESLPPEAAAKINQLLDAYFAIGKTLAADKTQGIADPARAIASTINTLLKIEIPGAPHFWHNHDEAATVRGKALEMIKAANIKDARLIYADLSIALSKLTKATGVPASYAKTVQELHCPMYREGQGGSAWLQKSGDVRNPYFGSTMLRCFDRRVALPVTGGSDKPKTPASDHDHGDHPTEPDPDDAPPPALPEAAQDQLDRLMRSYLSISQLLTENKLNETGPHLVAIRQAASALGDSAKGAVAQAAAEVKDASTIASDDLKAFRKGFKPLSEAMFKLARLAPPRASAVPTLYQAYCPMVKADWLQTSKVVANPYDPKMLRCGKIKATLPVRQTVKD